MKSGHYTTSGLSGNSDLIAANLEKMLREDESGQRDFSPRAIELNAYWHRDNAPNHAVTKFSREYGFSGPSLMREYKRRYPEIFIDFGLMEPEEPTPAPQPKQPTNDKDTAVQPTKPQTASMSWGGTALLLATAVGGAWYMLSGDDEQQNDG